MKLSSLAALAVVLSTTLALAAESPKMPLPEIIISKTATPPTVDGAEAPGEWDRAPGMTAFTLPFSGLLCDAQSVAKITYDDEFIYVLIKNNRGPQAGYSLLSKDAREPDDGTLVFGTSNEIWITPPASPAETYQTMFNTYPGVFDVKMIPSLGYTSSSWNGKWTIKVGETSDYWIVEAKAPIKSFGVAKIADGAKWRALFCTDAIGGAGFAAWAPGGSFAEINRHGFVTFKDNSPVFQLLDVESIRQGKFSFPMAVTGPLQGEAKVTVTARFGPEITEAESDKVLTKTVTVAGGKRQDFVLEGDVTQAGLPLKPVEIDAKTHEKKDFPAGFCEITAKDNHGAILYHQVFPFVVDGYKRTPPAVIRKTKYEDAPFGVTAQYAPISKVLIVKIDRLYMGNREHVVAGTATLKDLSGKVIATKPISPFILDYSKFPIELKDLQVPVETEADWAASTGIETKNKDIIAQMKANEKENVKIEAENKKAEEENPKLPEQKKPLKPIKPLLPTTMPLGTAAAAKQPGEYRLEVTLKTDDGKDAGTVVTPVRMLAYEFEWMNNNIGVSDKVIRPWTPVEVKGSQVSMWNKVYQLDGMGLAQSVTNAGSKQLSGPMKLVAVVDGKETIIAGGAPQARKLTEAGADLEGSADFGALKINVKTRVEFDGFVLNTMQLAPSAPTKLDRLSLVITMPKSEAECFVTTAGGWNSTFGWTPKQWDSRETSAGSIQGNFVPYVFLTDSDRGLCVFADTDKGWILDPNAATQEFITEGDTVTLRYNFVTRPGTIDKPTTIQYGWMVTPQKPQPKDWRVYHIGGLKTFPQQKCVMYADGSDWAVVYPYYSSPFPWHYDISKAHFDTSRTRGVATCAGNIMHSIGRYMDYKKRQFNLYDPGRLVGGLAVDWGQVMGEVGMCDVALSKGPTDFRLWHWDRWIKESGLTGLYFDETYLSEDRNFLTGGAYILPDGRIQPGYHFLGMREMSKRLRYLFDSHGMNGMDQARLFFHVTAQAPVYAWMPDFGMEGENVEPTSKEDDYIEALPASRLRALGMGRNLGTVSVEMCQAYSHGSGELALYLGAQQVGWMLAHDVIPNDSPFWDVLARENEMWREDITFLPYWKKGLGIGSDTKDVLVSAHVRAGNALLWVVNTSRQDAKAAVNVDLAKLKLDGSKVIACDAETGERVKIENGKFVVDVPARFWRAIRIMERRQLKGHETFVATFDAEGAAEEAVGYRYGLIGKGGLLAVVDGGKSGKCAPLDGGIWFETRLQAPAGGGSFAFDVKIDPNASGAVVNFQGLSLGTSRGKLTLAVTQPKIVDEPVKGKDGKVDANLPPRKVNRPITTTLGQGASLLSADWHRVQIKWQGNKVQVLVDGKESIAASVQGDMPFQSSNRRGHDINDNYKHPLRPSAPRVQFGSLPNSFIDNLVMESPE